MGTGWAFLVNGISFGGGLCSLSLLRVHELHVSGRARRAAAGLVEGFRYVWQRPDLRAILVMLFLIGTFGLNFPIFISTMAVSVFHLGAERYGLLSSSMAIGTVTGALLAANRERPYFRHPARSAALFGGGCPLAAIMPELPAVRRSARHCRHLGADLHQRDQQPHATLDRARHAWSRDGDPPGDRARYDADRRTSGRLGRGPFGPRWALALGGASGSAGRIRRGVALAREDRRRCLTGRQHHRNRTVAP